MIGILMMEGFSLVVQRFWHPKVDLLWALVMGPLLLLVGAFHVYGLLPVFGLFWVQGFQIRGPY